VAGGGGDSVGALGYLALPGPGGRLLSLHPRPTRPRARPRAQEVCDQLPPSARQEQEEKVGVDQCCHLLSPKMRAQYIVSRIQNLCKRKRQGQRLNSPVKQIFIPCHMWVGERVEFLLPKQSK
jgi:hypothetical protein